MIDRRSEALAQLLETALSEELTTPLVNLLGALPIPLAVVQSADLRVLAINPPMAAIESPRAAEPQDSARLLEVNAAKTEFLKMAAHELRTPLGVIHGYGSLLSQGGLSPEHQQLAGLRVYQKARQLSRLIMDLTLMARIDELTHGLARERLDLTGLVEEIVGDVRRRYPDLAIELSLTRPSAQVLGNSYWLQLAVRELFDNAIRFRPGPTGRIDVALDQQPGFHRLSVVDDGFGIDPAEHGRLFQRFSRIETDENHHLVGMGIGLYLVREVATAHQGRVGVKSRPGQGSEFTFELPNA